MISPAAPHLACLPAGWGTSRVKQLFAERDLRSTDGSEELFSLSKTLGLLPRSEITNKVERAESLEGYKRFLSGDLVMNKMQAWNGVFGFAGGQSGLISPDYAIFSVIAKIDPRYFTYMFKTDLYAGVFGQLARGMGTAFLRLNTGDFGGVDVPLPPLPQQVAIANFLDEQTARIDALIAEKDRLLDVLAEQRVSVAEQVLAENSTLTRGKLGYYVDLLPGYSFSSDEFTRNPDDIPLLRGVNVAPAKIRWDDAVYWTHEGAEALERFRLQVDDVVLGMDRPWISAGARVAMIDATSQGALLLQRVCRLRGKGQVKQRFIFYVLSSDAFRQSVEVDLTGVSVPHISPEQVLRFKVPVLSLDEQQRRCDDADSQIAQIVQLEAQTGEMLDRLREYRSSLISAAVTGQLDINSYKEAA